ncbi:ABC transporter substrate-binding protein [Microbacterium sp. NPDC076768]|uniref:ABC transporter substrate-binding protein n=1 Tax=Microbacterium sp. NPDC076768 TaxID=3154858 RepID=UPI00342F3C6A
MTKRSLSIVGVVAIGALTLAGCSASGDADSTGGDYASDATFTMAVKSDAGALDPQMGAGSVLNQLTQFAYDSLVSVDGADGSIKSQLATEWTVAPTELTFTLADSITCADGSAFTAETAVRNIEFVTDPANESPLRNVFVPAGATATADGNVLSVSLESPSAFAINGFGALPMVCDAGMDDRAMLATGTAGSGPYVLTNAVPNDQYTYEIREGYTWGPDGATTADEGVPTTLNVRVIENETTAANLLLSGDINAGAIVGSDAQRLDGADLYTAQTEEIIGQQWYNQGEGRVTSDPAVRMALTQAADYEELVKVVGAGNGAPPTSFAALTPAACQGEAVVSSMPAFDSETAADLLDAAGWTMGSGGVREKDGEPLAIKFVYNAAMGSGGTAGAELIVPQWEAIGAQVELEMLESTALQANIFGQGDWDVVWISLNVNTPDQIIGFLSGDASTNFAKIDNDDYNAAVAKASELPGAEGCDAWLEGESALVEAADAFPFANTSVKTFGNGAEFSVGGDLEPLTIRMLG